MSSWADAAARYRDGRELRTSKLKSRFIVKFEGEALVIILPSGANRRVDSGEFASAWALLEAGAPATSIRMVTPSGQYLEAIRADLLAAGLGGGGTESDDDVDVGTTAAALLDEATSRIPGSVPAPPLEALPSAMGADASEALLAERDAVVRELATSKAALAVVEENLAVEAERVKQLEAALASRPKGAAQPAGTGAKPDPIVGFAAFIDAELKASEAIDPQVRSGLHEALAVSLGHPDLAVVQCRKVAEAIAAAQYLRVTGADEVPKYFKAVDMLEDVRDREGVDMVIWNLHRNIFRISNPAAHLLRTVGSRQFALTLVAMVLVVATHVRTGR